MKSIRTLVQGFLSRRQQDQGMMLTSLWANWEEVVGPDLAEIARPLGHRDKKLVLGAEDSMTIQEITYLSPEILERVHEFLGRKFFDKISVELIKGRTPLDTVSVERKIEYVPFRPPEAIGELLPWMQDDSPVARCYRKYVRLCGKHDE